MSVDRCDIHSRHYDTDRLEECPLCLDAKAERLYHLVAADVFGLRKRYKFVLSRLRKALAGRS